ncbi:hypothetical protein ScPMuIL_011223 [Solemya velum]
MGNLFNKKDSKKTKSSFQNGFDSVIVEDRSVSDASLRTTDPTRCVSNVAGSVHSEAVASLASLSPGLCLSGSQDMTMVLYNYQTCQVQQRWKCHERAVTKVCYAEHCDRFFSCSRDKTARMWKRDQTTPLTTFSGHEFVLTALDVQTGRDILCTGSRDNTIRLWDITSGECLSKKEIPRNLVTDAKFVKNSDLLVQTGEDKEVRVFDTRTMDIVHTFLKNGLQYIQTSCDITVDGQYCVTSSNGFNGAGCEATLWDFRSQKPVHEYKGHVQCIEDCIFLTVESHDYIITCSRDNTVRVWHRDLGTCVVTYPIDGAGPLTSVIGYSDGSVCVGSFTQGIHQLRLTSDSLQPVCQF